MRLISRRRRTIAAIYTVVALAACNATPVGPTRAGAAGGSAVLAQSSGQQNLTPADFASRGWECRNSPVPGRVVCSRPLQGFPAIPPPSDRPPTYTLLVWENGIFAGTLILVRTDLYQGQSCESTGLAYINRPVIGYYECLHNVGG